jgi:hypothetical protein
MGNKKIKMLQLLVILSTTAMAIAAAANCTKMTERKEMNGKN